MDVSLSHYLVSGFADAFQPFNFAMMLLGLTIGIIGGMLPGITVVTSIALFIPFTFTMPTDTALIALGAIFSGATYGGANAAILINTPGQPGSIATTFDGYPMTRNGRAEDALFGALIASVFGGVFGVIILLFFFGPLSTLALQFGPAAFFWLAVFGLTTLAAMSPGNMIKGLIGGGIGLALSTVGLDPIMGTPRFTFGFYPLVQGFNLVVVMIGIFSISQMLILAEDREKYIAAYVKGHGVIPRVIRHLARKGKRLLVQSAAIGTFVGTLPGAGGSIAAIIAYNEAKRWDRDPDRFGKGEIDGVVAPECANNACVGGALVPLMSLGIPGNASAAVLMGGLLGQGLVPGPTLLTQHADIAYTFIMDLIVVNIMMFFVGTAIIYVSSRILSVPKIFIIPTVIVLAVIGSYSLRDSMFDVGVMFATGVGSYFLSKVDIQPAPIGLGLVLGPIIEDSLATSLRLAKASSIWDVLVLQPIPAILIVLCIVAVALPIIMQHKKSV